MLSVNNCLALARDNEEVMTYAVKSVDINLRDFSYAA